MFTISVCMIVKNEEDNLPRILECAKQFADEIVVVDTGSTDSTKQIAKKFADKVFDFEWCDDFSAARNFAFSLASCDFQMWLDADDFITEKNILRIQSLKKQCTDTDVFMCKYNFFDLTYYRERILRRSKNFKWQGFVHEVISPYGKIEYTDIEIEHRKTKPSDPKRNLRLYQNALKKGRKFNAREQYYYSRELYYNNKYIKAIEGFKKFLKMPNLYPPDQLGATLLLSECQSLIGENETALATLFSALQKFTPTAELCCKIAYLFEAEKKTESAIFWFKCALECPKQTEGFVQQEFEGLVPCIELSKLLYTADYASAKKFHKQAEKIAPNNKYVVYNQQFFEN